MLLSRQEMSFDFGGARLEAGRDKALLGWMMNQFLYGEVTGIQCGHWLYQAPDLEAAVLQPGGLQHLLDQLADLVELGADHRENLGGGRAVERERAVGKHREVALEDGEGTAQLM